MGQDGQVSFDELWRQVRRGFKLPLTFAAILAVCTCVYLRATTPLYEAKITITARAAGDDAVNGSKLLDLGALGGSQAQNG